MVKYSVISSWRNNSNIHIISICWFAFIPSKEWNPDMNIVIILFFWIALDGMYVDHELKRHCFKAKRLSMLVNMVWICNNNVSAGSCYDAGPLVSEQRWSLQLQVTTLWAMPHNIRTKRFKQQTNFTILLDGLLTNTDAATRCCTKAEKQ